MLWKMQCFALQSMGRTIHKFPVYTTRNVQTQLKSTVAEEEAGEESQGKYCVHSNSGIRLMI